MADAKPANWDFKLKDMDGKEVLLSSFKDQGKVVLLNFWATWCGPARRRFPASSSCRKSIATSSRSSATRSTTRRSWRRSTPTEYKMNYPILLGEGREDVQDAYGPIWGIPASFIISKDGKVCRKHMGIAPKAVFEKEVVALM